MNVKKILQILTYEISKIENNDTLKIVGVNDEVKKIILKSSTFSITRKLRMYVLSEAIKIIRNNSIKDEFVECGVWKVVEKQLMNI